MPGSGSSALDAGLGDAALERLEAERLSRADRAGALDLAAQGTDRGPGEEVGGERVPVEALDPDLGELLTAGSRGDRDDVGAPGGALRLGRAAGRALDEPLGERIEAALQRLDPGDRTETQGA